MVWEDRTLSKRKRNATEGSLTSRGSLEPQQYYNKRMFIKKKRLFWGLKFRSYAGMKD